MIQQLLRSSSALFLVVAVCLVPRMTWAGTIHIGSISANPAGEVRKFVPLARYLAGELKSEGIDQGKVVVAKSISQMVAFLREGKVDLYIDSPFPSVAVSRQSGSKFLLRRWKKGLGEYHTVIFTRKESGISRLEDLKGKVIAFDEPFSTSGYFLPKIALLQAGITLVLKQDTSDRVGPGEVGYVFSYDHENIMVWVLRGKVAAGALGQQNFVKWAKGKLDSLTIVHKTFSVPRQIVSVRADLPSTLVARIKDILLRMDQSEEGRKVLQAFEMTTRFDELPDQALAQLLGVQRMIDAEFRRQAP